MSLNAWEPRMVVNVVFTPSEPPLWWGEAFTATGVDLSKVCFVDLTARAIDKLRPPSSVIDDFMVWLSGTTLRPEARTEVGLSFSGTKEDFQVAFGNPELDPFALHPYQVPQVCEESEPSEEEPRKRVKWGIPPRSMLHGGGRAVPAVPVVLDSIFRHVSVMEFSIRAVSKAAENGPANLMQPAVVRRLLGASELDCDGNGVEVAIVDSGIWSRHFEGPLMPDADGAVAVGHPVKRVHGVWSDGARTGQDYWEVTPGQILGGNKVKPASVPSGGVWIDYSCMHPRLEQRPWLTGQPFVPQKVLRVGDLDPMADEQGHGTAVVYHLLNVAPACTVTLSKFVDESGVRNYPVAAFQRAVNPSPELNPIVDPPDVVLCSWVMNGVSVALALEIANAVAKGCVVVFAAGNGREQDIAPAEWKASPWVPVGAGAGVQAPVSQPALERWDTCPVAHPDIISVGGAALAVDGHVEPSSTAAHFVSKVFGWQPPAARFARRYCPDVVGLVAPTSTNPPYPPGNMPTPAPWGSTLDLKPEAAGGGVVDGEFLAGGTSMAAGQVAGVVALLIQAARPARMMPVAIKNVLMATAVPLNGASWSESVGHGLVSASAAVGWMTGGFHPFIRKAMVGPTVDKGELSGSPDCPDIVLRMESKLHNGVVFALGPSSKQWAAAVLDSTAPLHAYVRVQNRGNQAGRATVRLLRWTLRGGGAVDLVGATTDNDIGPGGFMVFGPIKVSSGSLSVSSGDRLVAIVDRAGSTPIGVTVANVEQLVATEPTVAARLL